MVSVYVPRSSKIKVELFCNLAYSMLYLLIWENTMGRRVDITGNTYGRLTVLGYYETTPNSQTKWECLCECGEIRYVFKYALTGGITLSCGCYRKNGKLSKGMSVKTANKLEHETYRSWASMIARCTNENNTSYYNYGGRGILIEDGWEVFNVFLEDMGVMPVGGSIERLDVDGNYSKGNCIWLDKSLQGRNKRNTVWVTFKGERVCLAEAIEVLGLQSGTVRQRIRRGMSPEDALY